MSDDEVVLTDAMKCNAMDSYFNVLDKKGRVGLGIPGCTTGFIQNNDVTCHGPLAGAYKRRENSESLAALREGYPVPPADKQVVYDRTIGAWEDLNHERISFGFVQIGVANDLFGTQDKELSKDLLPIWLDQKMSEKREEIRQEIEAGVKSGKYTNFKKDAYAVIIPYPADMRFEEPGGECFEWYGEDGDADDEDEPDPKDVNTDGEDGDGDEKEGEDEDENEGDDCFDDCFDDLDDGDDGDDKPGGGGAGGGGAASSPGSGSAGEAEVIFAGSFTHGGSSASSGGAGVGGGSTGASCVDKAALPAPPSATLGASTHADDDMALAIADHVLAHSSLPDGTLPYQGDEEDKSSAVLFFTKEDEKHLASAEAGLKAVRETGGDAIAEQLLLRRIGALKKKQGQTKNRVAVYLAGERSKRFKAERIRAAEREKGRLEIKKSQLELAKLELQLKKERAEHLKSAAATKQQIQDFKEAEKKEAGGTGSGEKIVNVH